MRAVEKEIRPIDDPCHGCCFCCDDGVCGADMVHTERCKRAAREGRKVIFVEEES